STAWRAGSTAKRTSMPWACHRRARLGRLFARVSRANTSTTRYSDRVSHGVAASQTRTFGPPGTCRPFDRTFPQVLLSGVNLELGAALGRHPLVVGANNGLVTQLLRSGARRLRVGQYPSRENSPIQSSLHRHVSRLCSAAHPS